MQALPSKAILGSAYQWMVTSKDMVNTGKTKTSSLFQEKQSGAQHGSRRELIRRGFHISGLLWFLGRHLAKEHPCCHGCTICTEMGAGDDICSDITLHMPSTRSSAWHILRHILDNTCWHQKMCPRPITGNYIIYGPWQWMHQYMLVQKGQPYCRGTISLWHMLDSTIFSFFFIYFLFFSPLTLLVVYYISQEILFG